MNFHGTYLHACGLKPYVTQANVRPAGYHAYCQHCYKTTDHDTTACTHPFCYYCKMAHPNHHSGCQGITSPMWVTEPGAASTVTPPPSPAATIRIAMVPTIGIPTSILGGQYAIIGFDRNGNPIIVHH